MRCYKPRAYTLVELMVGTCLRMMSDIMGAQAARHFLPLIGTCAFFILFGNALGLDAGVLALEGPHAYGAAWYRLFTKSEPGFGFVDEDTPEITIAIVPSRRGKGAGKELLHALLDRARAEGYTAVSLSAERGQTAYYERFGFRVTGEIQARDSPVLYPMWRDPAGPPI